MNKPAYKSTEFWFTLVSFIFSGLFLTGVISENDTKEQLIDVVSHAVQSVFLIGGQFAIFYKYIQSRKQQKIEEEKTKQKELDSMEKELENYIGIDKTYKTISINEATAGELIQLPRIGPAMANKIIKYREEKGGFKHITEITKVSGIGNSIYSEIKNNITI